MTAVWVVLGICALAVVVWLLRRARVAPSATGVPDGVRLIYTTHARERMAQRSISTEQVEAALSAPDRVEPDAQEESLRFEKGLPDLLLKVWVVADPWPPVDQVVIKTTAAQHFTTFSIPTKSVGRVIGRGGATIREVQDASQARVTIRAKDGLVHIRADSRSAVDRARRMVVERASSRSW